MKKLVLFLFLLTASLSLSSFGILSNPKMADRHGNLNKSMTIHSKSTVNSALILKRTLVLNNEVQATAVENSNFNFLRSFFSFLVTELSQIVIKLISK